MIPRKITPVLHHCLDSFPAVAMAGPLHCGKTTLAAFQHSDRRWQVFHMRTAAQRELDLVVEVDGELWAFEAKLTATPRPSDLARLNANADLIGAHRRFLVCQRRGSMEKDAQFVCDLEALTDYIEGR